MDDFKQQLEELTRRVDNLSNNPLPRQQFGQRSTILSFPLESTTRKTISSIISYPVIVRLQNTDAATTANYGTFFTAQESCVVVAVTEVHGTLGTDASAVTLQIEKLTGTTAPDSGTELLSTAFNLKGTINTVQYGVLVVNGENILGRGDRLCLKDAGVLTAVANVQVTVYIQTL